MSRIDDLIEELCPNGVEYKTIGEIATYRRGSFPQPYTNSSFYGGEGAKPFVQVADIEDEGFLLKETTKQTISEIAQPKSIFVPKDTVICSIQGTIGRVAITQYDAYVDRTIAIFDSFKIEINKRFFAYCIQVKFGIEKQFARGSTLKTITKEEFTKFFIPVPPLEVQCEIVHILDDFTLLSTELSTELSAELKARQKQYEYYKNKLFEFSNEVEKIELGKLCEIITKQTGFDYSKSIKDALVREYKSGFLPYIQTKFFEGKNFEYNTDYYISKEVAEKFPKIVLNQKSILLSIVGASIGNVGLFNGEKECFLGGAICVAKVFPEYNIDYIYYYLTSIYGQKQIFNKVKGAGQATVTIEDIRKFIIPIPNREIQNEIVRKIEKFDEITNDIIKGLLAEIEARQKQYEYYRDKLLTFKKLKVEE